MKTHTWTDVTPVGAAKPQPTVVAIIRDEPPAPRRLTKAERRELQASVAQEQANEARRHPRHFVNHPLAQMGELLLNQKGA